MKKRLTALFLAIFMLASALVFTVAADEPLTVVSAVIAGKKQILVTFSEPVNVSELLPFMGIRLHTSSDPNSTGVVKITADGKEMYAQWESKSLVPVEGSNNTQYMWTFTGGFDSFKSVYDIAFKKAEPLKNYQHLYSWFCFEEKEYEEDGKTSKNSNVDDVINITSVNDPTKRLQATTKGRGTAWSGHYVPITIDPEVYLPEVEGAVPNIKEEQIRDITVSNITVANEKQLVLEFSENVTAYVPEGQFLKGSIRYVNKTTNGTIYSDITGDGKREYLESAGICEVYDNKLVWTATGDGALSDRSVKDILEKTGLITVIPADPENDIPEEIVDVINGAKNWKIVFVIEGMEDSRIPYPFEGYINNIRSTDDEFGILKANKVNANNASGASLIMDLSGALEPANGELAYEENVVPGVASVEITGATVLNDHQIEISFSEEIVIAGSPDPYVALCYVDKDGNIVEIDSDGDDIADKALIFEGRISVSGYTLVWTKFESELLTMKQIFEKTGFENNVGYEDWTLCLYVLENEDVSAPEGTIYKPGVIDQIRSIDGTKMVYGTKTTVEGGEVVPYADILFYDLAEADTTNIEVVYTPPVIIPITPVSMTIIDSRKIEIVFSEAVKLITEEMPWTSIRYTDANNNLIYVDKDGNGTKETPLQFHGTLSEKDGKIYFLLDEGLVLKNILEKKGYENYEGYEDWLVQFSIEDKDNKQSSAIKEYLYGYVDSIIAAEGLGFLQANKPNIHDFACDGFYYGEFGGIENVEEPYYPYRRISIVSVEVINEKQLEITFSEEVKIVGEGAQPVFAGIRYTNDKNGLINSNGPLQAYGTLTQGKDKTKLQWSPTGGALSGKKFSDVLAKKGYEGVEGYENWLVQFAFEGMPCSLITDPLNRYVDNIQSLDGSGRLYGNAPNANNVYDGCYFNGITGAENENKPYVPGGYTAMEPISAEILNAKQIAINFPCDVQIIGENSVFVGLRYVDENNNLIYYDIDGNGTKDPMQSYGEKTAQGNQIIFLPTGGTLSSRSIKDLIAKKGYEDCEGSENWTLSICIEGMPASEITSPIRGYIDNVQSTDGTYILKANRLNGGSDAIYDGYYIREFEGLENADKPYIPVVIRPEWPEDTREGVEVVSVKVLNDSQLQVKFSEPVKLNGTKSPWVCIRYVRYDATGRPSYGTYKNAEGKTVVMQYSGSLVLNGTDTAIFNYSLGISMSDVVNMKAAGEHGQGYDLMFCIEGMPNPELKTHELAYIDNIVSTDGKRMLKGLFAARDLQKNPDGSWRGEYDGLYVPIEGLENASKRWEPPYHANLTVKSVRVLNAYQLEVTFSDPIQIVGSSNPKVFAAIRYTDENFNVIKDSVAGYLQWMGSFTCNGTNVVKWNLNSNVSKSLEELLYMKGYEKKGYRLTFCIEGMPDDGTNIKKAYYGYIDNVQSLDGKKLLKATHKKWDSDSVRAVYDGYYHTKFLDIENSKNSSVALENRVGVEVEKVQIISDYELKIVFSEDVMLVGEGTAATQYCPVYAGIRFTDANLTTQSLDGKLLDFPGDFYLMDGSNTATWEIRSKEYTLQQLLSDRKYEKFTPSFCIEGTEDVEAIPSPQAGYVDNIQSMDGKLLLVSTVADLFGVKDAFYSSEILAKEKDPNAHEKIESELIDTLYMTNAEREAFNALSIDEHNALVGGAEELLNNAVIGTLPLEAWNTYLKLLSHNKLEVADVKSYLVALNGSHDAKYPLSVKFDVSDMQFGPEDMIYVYRINADGTVDRISKVTAMVDSDGNVTTVKFMTSKFADFFITNRALDTDIAGLSLLWIIGGAAAALVVIAAVIIAIVAKKKKK